MVFTSPFRSRSYERLKEDESNATVASSSSSIKSPEPSSSVSRVEEKTPTTNKIAFPEHEDDSMRTPSPEEQPSSSSKRNNNNNTNASGRKVLGEMTNDVSMTPLSAKLKNLKFSSPTDHQMSPATKFVNRIARHTKKDKNAGSFGRGRVPLGLGRGKFTTTKRAPSRFASNCEKE
mmetsp:Transcript_10027/g.28880  ORF Transcript_10027/g.28880 Transcript_10027/m.28880 type:complete len:176 (-) Transcript_10027:1190-1717(-)